ncbi:MAG: hypothetical protein IJ446_11695 [Oscillospiraceae bacterium]|nr:hypothetical protein [Oscillospiraceae bacterium]
MTYKVIATDKFLDDVKYYIKKKKFTHIDEDIDKIAALLEQGNLVGDPISNVSIKNKTYKVRVANSDTHQGKSNGYRIIYYAVTEDFEVYLLTIYYKKDDIRIPTDKEIAELIEKYCN